MKTTSQLKQWLLTKPIIFALILFCSVTVLGLLLSVIQTFLPFEPTIAVSAIFIISLAFAAYYTIKKLPHDKMPQKDFIAITNGASIISLASSLFILSIYGIYAGTLRQKLMMMYLLHPGMLNVILGLLIAFALYILGVAVSGVYAKYKRATTIGVTPWKVILSMPFAFLLMWTPGYLIEEKGNKSNLLIKSKWYTRFNNWVMANFSNLLFTFLFLLFAKTIIAGTSTLILTIALLIIYTLWYVKHKSDFVKNIDKGYALTAVGINIAIILAMILTAI